MRNSFQNNLNLVSAHYTCIFMYNNYMLHSHVYFKIFSKSSSMLCILCIPYHGVTCFFNNLIENKITKVSFAIWWKPLRFSGSTWEVQGGGSERSSRP